MFRQVNTKNPSEVEAAVNEIYRGLYSEGDSEFIPRSFSWANQFFSGQYEGYQAVDALYHDFEHTLQGTLCLARLLAGREEAGARPALPRRNFELGLLAILFHDSGYLKKEDDREGTGAKYTLVHVDRSAQFASEYLSRRGFSAREVQSIQNMIRCTGVNVDLASIPFTDDLERMVGAALGTSDLLGQMAAPDYVDKLPILFLEFEEAARFDKSGASRFARFDSADDLIRNSPAFWSDYVEPRIKDDFRGLYRYLNDPYPDGPNVYLEGIEKNLERLRRMISQQAARG